MKKLCAFVACLLVPSWAQSQTVVDSFTAPLALPLGGTGTTSSYGMANAVGTTGLVSFSGTLSVTGAANNGSGAIRLTVPTAHLYTGGLYTVAGVGGVTNANGEWRFTIIDGTHADLGSSTFAGSYTGGGTVTAAAGYTTTVWSPSSCADSTINLPASPGDNEPHTIINAGNCPSNGLIISGNGHNIGTASGIVSIAPGPVAVRYSVSAGAVWTSSFAAGQLLPSEFGAVADGTTDDTSALQDAINASCRSGLPVNLAGGTYEITQSLLGCSNLTIRGPGTIFLPNADFDCQDSVSCRYASNAVGLNLSGMKASPWTPNSNITLDNFTIQYQTDHALKRYVDPITCQNDADLTITHLELFGFPVAHGIRCATLSGSWLLGWNYIHDFYNDDTTWGSGAAAQITGIEIDNDLINSVQSVGGRIINNYILNMIFGPDAITAYDYQTDGINIVHGDHMVVEGNLVDTVGEDIDTFGHYGSIVGNVLLNGYLHCVNFKHNASWNVLTGNSIYGCGIGGVFFAADAVDGNIDGNIVSGNRIGGIDPDNVHSSAGSKAPIRMTGVNPTYNPTNNVVTDNLLDPAPNGNFVIFDGGFGSGNMAVGNVAVSHGSSGTDYLSQNKATSFQRSVPGYPTIASGFGTSPSLNVVSGYSAFQVVIGSGGSASSGVLTLPQSDHGWACSANDRTTQSSVVFATIQTDVTATSATLKNFNTAGSAAAWAAGDVLQVKCEPY